MSVLKVSYTFKKRRTTRRMRTPMAIADETRLRFCQNVTGEPEGVSAQSAMNQVKTKTK